MEELQVMLDGQTEWTTVCKWDNSNSPFDGGKWLDHFKDRVGSGVAPMPDGSGSIALDRVWAVRIQ